MEVYNRDLPPSHCILEITEFSLKAAEQVETHQSEIFEAGGCKWSLSLYPNGNKKRGGKDHISLYLNIEETDKFSFGWDVFINYKLFVLNQTDDSYLSIQDAHGAVRRFHEQKKQWGFARLLSLETLRDQSNGYLLDDTCIFGAEVFVLKAATGKSKSPTTSNMYYESTNKEKSSSSTPDDVDGNDKMKSSSSTPDDQANGNGKEKLSSSAPPDDHADGNDKEKLSSSTPDDQANNEVVNTPSLPSTAEGVVVYNSEYPPVHYILELDNFSLLRGSKHCTDMFEHGGYNWSLTLHHNGNKEDGGEGYISLYLKLEDQNTFSSGWEVFANCKFFVQDQNKTSSYLTIQDATQLEGTFMRFHKYKKEWGIAKLMSLETFKQTSNGYLVNDHCVFGVEIFVSKATEKKGTLTVGQTSYSSNKINFKLESFSTLGEDHYESVNYQAYGGYKWRLVVYPKFKSRDCHGVGVELHLDGYTKITNTVCTEFTLRVLDQLHDKHKESTHAWHNPPNQYYRSDLNSPQGSYPLLAPEELYKPENGYLLNDTLIAQVEFHN